MSYSPLEQIWEDREARKSREEKIDDLADSLRVNMSLVDFFDALDQMDVKDIPEILWAAQTGDFTALGEAVGGVIQRYFEKVAELRID